MGKYKIPPDYAMYKGKEMIAFGSVDEIMAQTGLSRSTIYVYMSKAHAKRHKTDDFKRVVRVEEEE